MKDFFEMAEGYEPCNPDSLPKPRLADHVKEPVDQWILEHETVEQDTYEKARMVWAELGDQAIPELDSHDEHDETDPLPDLKAEYIRQVLPATAKNYCEKLKPMVFESAGLAMIPLDLLANVESEPVIIGQMFGVPRDDGYVPVLVLETTITGGPHQAIDQLHGIWHLLNDIYSDDPTELQVLF